MVVISTTNCNVVLAHTLFLFFAPEMQGVFAIRVTIICMQLSDNFLHFTAMHINITVGLNSKCQPSTHMIASATGKGHSE